MYRGGGAENNKAKQLWSVQLCHEVTAGFKAHKVNFQTSAVSQVTCEVAIPDPTECPRQAPAIPGLVTWAYAAMSDKSKSQSA